MQLHLDSASLRSGSYSKQATEHGKQQGAAHPPYGIHAFELIQDMWEQASSLSCHGWVQMSSLPCQDGHINGAL